MIYSDRFIPTDNLIIHLDPLVKGITDSALKSNYSGFLSVSAVTVYELAIKDIFMGFAKKKNKVFGHFIENHFSRINGRIRIKDVKNQHIKPFGIKYLNRFEKKILIKEKDILNTIRKDLRSSYSNLILSRHKFVHEGITTLTFEEVLANYELGKHIIHILNSTMRY